MNPLIRKLTIAGLFLSLVGCRLTVISTSDGDVDSASDTRNCPAENICEFNITSDDFNETFTAVPRAGFVFKQWAAGPGFICADSTNPTCLVSNLGLGTISGVMAYITGDQTSYAMPLFDFVGTDTDGDSIEDHLDEDDDNDGVFDVDDLYPLDPDLSCPAAYALRTPEQVLSDLRAAIAAQDWEDVACHYRPNAFVINDQGILVGHADIVESEQSLNSLFDGIAPQIFQEDVFNDTARVIFSLDAGWVEIEDGVQSYVIEGGVITRQTWHGLITFNGPPP